jgi:hypothetical protein
MKQTFRGAFSRDFHTHTWKRARSSHAARLEVMHIYISYHHRNGIELWRTEEFWLKIFELYENEK